MKLVIVIVMMIVAGGVEQSKGCACCLPEGAWGTYKTSLHDHLDKQAIGVAMENAIYTGRVSLGPEYKADELYREIQLQYEDSCFSVRSEVGKEIALIIFENEVEGFMADLGEGATVYREWRFNASVDVKSSVWAKYLGREAKVILQGYYNGCFNPSGMKHWIIRFSDSEDSRFRVVLHGEVEMNMEIWDRSLKKRLESD